YGIFYFFFFSSRRRHTRSKRDWSSDVCSSDLVRDGAGTITDVTANLTAAVAAGFIKGIAVDPQDWQRAFVVAGNRVAQTTDGGEIGRASCRERGWSAVREGAWLEEG